jgi:hypothetical protein
MNAGHALATLRATAKGIRSRSRVPAYGQCTEYGVLSSELDDMMWQSDGMERQHQSSTDTDLRCMALQPVGKWGWASINFFR